MRNPPAIALPVTAGTLARRFGLGAGVLTLALISPLAFQTGDPIWVGVLALTVVAQFWAWKENGRAPQGVLCWTGAHWTWSAWPQHEGCVASLEIDLPWCSVLRVCQAGQETLWIVLDAAAHRDLRWSAMRRALVAGRPAAP